MKHHSNDMSVLVIFFSRPETFAKVFEQVKIARPSKLFLYQDGPRPGRFDDIENIRKCREIASDINWDCEAHRLYQDTNFGCDPSEFIAIKWAFSMVDRCIVLEDDDVPSQSFFHFCTDLLEEYENDERVHMICGMNNLGTFENSGASYLFSRYGSIWGWATWKRCVDTWDPDYSFLDDASKLSLIKEFLNNPSYYEKVIQTCHEHRNSGKAHYETINGCSQYLYKRYNIVPVKNMISNIGIGANTTHSTDKLSKLPKAVQRLLFMDTHEIEFPLTYVNDVEVNEEFDKAYTRLMFPNKVIKLNRRLEGAVRRVIFR